MKFIADANLKPLVKRLRMLGIDCSYDGGMSLPDVIQRAALEERTLLTLKPVASSPKVNVFRLKDKNVTAQLLQIAGAIPIMESAAPFTRCLICNARLTDLSPPADVPKSVSERGLDVCRCPECERLYWAGSHIERMKIELKKTGIVI